MTETTRLALPLLAPAQAQKHVTVNEALARLDGLVQATVQGAELGVPPVGAQDGQVWIVAAPAVNEWAGWEGDLALFAGGGWLRLVARAGWRVWDAQSGAILVRIASDWVTLDVAMGLVSVAALGDGSVSAIGIGAPADATNGLVYRGTNALLWSDVGVDVTLNKAVVGADASLSFKTGYSGRALMGLLGNDTFAIKVSSDGAAYREALTADPATGRLSAPEGLDVAGSIAGSAVQSGPQDASAGRLLRVGAFGSNGAVALVPSGDLDAEALIATRVSAGAVAGNPFAASVIEVIRDTPSTIQLAYELDAGTAPRIAVRGNPGSGWSDWSVAYGTANLLGDVGFAAGVPNGAVIERGTATTGDYVRLADGTQICWTYAHVAGPCATAQGAGFRGGETEWVFPVAFAAGGVPVVTGAGGAAGTVWLAIGSAGSTSVALRPMGFVAVAADVTARMIAIGRWG